MLWGKMLSRDFLGYGGLFVGGVGVLDLGVEVVGQEGYRCLNLVWNFVSRGFEDILESDRNIGVGIGMRSELGVSIGIGIRIAYALDRIYQDIKAKIS